MADETIEDTASRGKIYRSPVVWIYETEIPSLLALIDVWHSWSRELQDDLAQRLVQRRPVDGLSVPGKVLADKTRAGIHCEPIDEFDDGRLVRCVGGDP